MIYNVSNGRKREAILGNDSRKEVANADHIPRMFEG